MFLIQNFVTQRALSIIVPWTGYPLTLLMALQHIELLKMFVSISDFWTKEKCRAFLIAMCGLHVVLNVPGYIAPFGLENDVLLNKVTLYSNCRLSTFVPFHGLPSFFCAIIFVLSCPLA